ncbi:MAG: toxin-antitoxin system YwqK family antitoxin [Flavobacteriales bacterium]
MEGLRPVMMMMFVLVNGGVLGQPRLVPRNSTTESNGVLFTGGQPVTGNVVDMAPNNGPIRSECAYVSGRKEGECRTNYPDEKPYVVEHYKSGVLDGERLEYSPEGVVTSRSVFLNGKRHGIVEERYPSGQLRSSYAYEAGKLVNGEYKEFDPDGKVSLEKSVSGGVVMREVAFKGGIKDGACVERHTNGAQKLEVTYRAGKEEGQQRIFDESGRLTQETTFKNGVKTGVAITYSSSGQIVKEETYQDGVLVGSRTTDYHSMGTKLGSAEFDAEGKKNGVEEKFWDDGTLRQRTRYEHGAEVAIEFQSKNDPSMSLSRLFRPDQDILFVVSHTPGIGEAVVLCSIWSSDNAESRQLRGKVVQWLKENRLRAYLGSMEVQPDLMLVINGINVASEGPVTGGPSPTFFATAVIPITLRNVRTETAANERIFWETMQYPDRQTALNQVLNADRGERRFGDAMRKLFPVEGRLEETVDSSGPELKTFTVDLKEGGGVTRGDLLDVVCKQEPTMGGVRVGAAKVVKFTPTGSAECKVTEGGTAIQECFMNGSVFVITKQ